MASYTNIDPNTLLPGEPWTSAKALASFENPQAIAEGAATSPVNAAGWHPYNLLVAGGAQTGIIYDFAVNGAVATVTSPDFVNGYEYRFVFHGMAITLGTSPISAGMKRSTDDTFPVTATVSLGNLTTAPSSGYFELPLCRLSNRYAVASPQLTTLDLGVAARVKGVRFTLSTTLTAGRIYMQRRLDYQT
jgi:hypothetical protein